MKRFLSILLCLVLVFALCACGDSAKKEPAANDRLAKIKAQGYIEICTEPYFAPCEFIDPTKEGNDQFLGYDMEMARYIADKMGVELRIVPLEYTAVLSSIVEGKYDLAISGISWSPEREEAANMSRGYFYDTIGCGLICRSEDADRWNDPANFKDAVIILQKGSVQEAIYKDNVPACKELKYASSLTDCYLAVQEGKADFCICNAQSAALYAEANGGLAVPEYRFDVDPEYGSARIMACKDDTDSLIAFVNDCITELVEADQINAWRDVAVEQAAALGLLD